MVWSTPVTSVISLLDPSPQSISTELSITASADTSTWFLLIKPVGRREVF